MAIVKSKLLKQISSNYPNFLKKDLEKFTNIILDEIKRALKRGDRVELRGFGVFSTNIQKARISRNPKTGEKVNTPEKKTIHFKMSKVEVLLLFTYEWQKYKIQKMLNHISYCMLKKMLKTQWPSKILVKIVNKLKK